MSSGFKNLPRRGPWQFKPSARLAPSLCHSSPPSKIRAVALTENRQSPSCSLWWALTSWMGLSLELGAVKFHEQRRSTSRPLFSRARACPCPRQHCYDMFMPTAHATIVLFLAQKPPPRYVPLSIAQCTGPRRQAAIAVRGRSLGITLVGAQAACLPPPFKDG